MGGGKVSLESAKNCNVGFAIVVSHVQVPARQGKDNTYRGEKVVERATGNAESMAFHWLNPFQERRLSSS